MVLLLLFGFDYLFGVFCGGLMVSEDVLDVLDVDVELRDDDVKVDGVYVKVGMVV